MARRLLLVAVIAVLDGSAPRKLVCGDRPGSRAHAHELRRT